MEMNLGTIVAFIIREIGKIRKNDTRRSEYNFR